MFRITFFVLLGMLLVSLMLMMFRLSVLTTSEQAVDFLLNFETLVTGILAGTLLGSVLWTIVDVGTQRVTYPSLETTAGLFGAIAPAATIGKTLLSACERLKEEHRESLTLYVNFPPPEKGSPLLVAVPPFTPDRQDPDRPPVRVVLSMD